RSPPAVVAPRFSGRSLTRKSGTIPPCARRRGRECWVRNCTQRNLGRNGKAFQISPRQRTDRFVRDCCCRTRHSRPGFQRSFATVVRAQVRLRCAAAGGGYLGAAPRRRSVYPRRVGGVGG